MKNKITAGAAPEDGGGAMNPDAMMKEAIRQAEASKAAGTGASGPHYDGGGTYNSGLRYAVGDGTTPINDGARVKMDLFRRSHDNLLSFVGNHITQMASNPNFTTPVPAAPALLALYTDFQTAQAAAVAAETALKDAAATRDAAQAALIEAMQTRGAYVQTASNGNREVIISSGLGVRNTPTPVGPLAPPINIRIDLNGVAGVMKFRWQPVAGARGYLVECSEDVNPRVWTQIKNTTKASMYLENMDVGKIYVFRIASQGGSTGQSPWSPEVVRGAA